MWVGFCLNTRKHFFVKVISKPTEGPQVALRNGTSGFWKSSSFQKSFLHVFVWQKKLLKKTVKKTRVNKEHFEVAKFTQKKILKRVFMFLFKIYLQKNSLTYTYYINLVARNMQRK